MTSIRQIEANRRNALRSTGPTSEAGKRSSRRNAVRHGLAAETVVEVLEDLEDYRGFEAAVIASYDARNAVERELVLRLASLLWRLRRATAVETDLLRIQADFLRDPNIRQDAGWSNDTPTPESPSDLSPTDRTDHAARFNVHCDVWRGSDSHPHSSKPSRDLARCFHRLVDVNSGGLFERLGRYETALSRQVLRTMVLLRSARAPLD
jgi:hypothetical protein